MAANCIEIVRFKLKDGVDRQQFLDQNHYVEENLVSRMPGFVSRETAEADGGEWVVVLHWEKPEDAQNSMNKFVAAQESHDFTALIQMDTFNMTRYAKV
jgi:heme-degrading monooxygenase HmoA